MNVQIGRIYEKLEQTFEDPSGDIDCALEALELISYLHKYVPCSKSQSLFHVIMQSMITGTQSQKRWKASCLVIKRACDEDGFKDAEHILTFLNHYFELVPRCNENYEPIQNAFCALTHTSSALIDEALKRFDPTKPSFVCGISDVFRGNKPSKLHEDALLFLPFICDRWFNARSPIMDSVAMRKFSIDWGSVVDCLGSTQKIQKAALTVFLGMVNSPHWCPCIVPEKWMLLEHFPLISDDLQSFHRYINNPDLIAEIRDVDNPMAMALWVGILWSKYMELDPEVQKQLKQATEDIAHNEKEDCLSVSEPLISKYLSNTNSELKEVEDKLEEYNGQPDDERSIALKDRIDILQQISGILDNIRLGITS